MFKIKNCYNLANKKQIQMEKARRAKKFAVGITVISAIGVTTCIMMALGKGTEIHKMCRKKALNAIEKTKDTIQDKADAVHAAADHVAKAANKAIKGIDKNANGVHEDIKDGYLDVKSDISETVENVSNDLKKADK